MHTASAAAAAALPVHEALQPDRVGRPLANRNEIDVPRSRAAALTRLRGHCCMPRCC